MAARLFGKALGADRLHMLHVDNGLMRKDESRNVLEMFKDLGLDANLHFIDATDDFLPDLGDKCPRAGSARADWREAGHAPMKPEHPMCNHKPRQNLPGQFVR